MGDFYTSFITRLLLLNDLKTFPHIWHEKWINQIQRAKFIDLIKKGSLKSEQEKCCGLVSGSALDGFLYRAFWWNRLLAANDNFIKNHLRSRFNYLFNDPPRLKFQPTAVKFPTWDAQLLTQFSTPPLPTSISESPAYEASIDWGNTCRKDWRTFSFSRLPANAILDNLWRVASNFWRTEGPRRRNISWLSPRYMGPDFWIAENVLNSWSRAWPEFMVACRHLCRYPLRPYLLRAPGS